jgi:hypothetical protein
MRREGRLRTPLGYLGAFAAKLPDRGDFKAYGERIAERQRDWARAVAESQRLADEFAELVRRPSIEALPLA